MKNFIFAVIALLMVACSQEQVLLPEPEITSPETRSTHIPLSEALKVADRMIRAVEPEGTRASARTVESIEYYGGSVTRSGEEEPMFYVVNYAGNKGFAILGADTRVDSIYAFSDEGHLDMNDTTFNEGLNMYFNTLSLIKPDTPQNPLDTTIHEFQPIDGQSFNKSYTYGPFLTPEVRQWHQNAPFNNLCPKVNGVLPAAGYAAIAIGQIMSYYETPKTYGQYSFDWEAINSAIYIGSIKNSGIPRLLAELGSKSNLNIDYSIDFSPCDIKAKYIRTFRAFGYNTPADFDNFSTEELERWIKREKPVLVRGTNDITGREHAWVIDGLHCDSWLYTDALGTYSISGEGLFFHCVWGWGGEANGYFKHQSGFTKRWDRFNDENDLDQWDSNWDNMVKIYKLGFCGNISPK